MIQLLPLGMTLAQTLIPGLVDKITGDKGKVVQKVAEIALEATGMAPDTSADDVTAALKANPEVYARVKEAAASVAIAELQAEVESARTVAQDTANARELYQKGDGKAQIIIAGIVFVGMFSLITALFMFPPPAASSEVVTLVVGALLGNFTQVVNFFFGSSKGSKDKSAALDWTRRL